MDWLRLLVLLAKCWLALEQTLRERGLILEAESRAARETMEKVNAQLDKAIAARKASAGVTGTDPTGGLHNDDPNLRD